MKVKILHAGMYSDFSTGPKVGARILGEGAVVEFPTDYAEGLIESGLASLVEESPDEVAVEVLVTDVARKLAAELGVDLAEVVGTGAAGKVLVRDVQGAARGSDKDYTRSVKRKT